MKKLFISFFVLIINCTLAQNYKGNTFYTSGDLLIGNYFGIDAGLNFILKEKYSFRFSYSGLIRRAKSTPKNYSSGILSAFVLGLVGPFDNLENYQICVGKIYPFNPKSTIRANLSIGLGYSTIKEPTIYEKSNGFFANNYKWKYHEYNTVSVIINPKIEFPFSRFYGLSISIMLKINKERTYFGIGFGHMIGKLRQRK